MLTKDGVTFSKIVLAVGRSDLRKGIDGLSTLISLKYGIDPLEKDTLFLFCGTRLDRIKGLLWTGDRYVLLYIRLADGRFQWPRTAAEARHLVYSDVVGQAFYFRPDNGRLVFGQMNTPF